MIIRKFEGVTYFADFVSLSLPGSQDLVPGPQGLTSRFAGHGRHGLGAVLEPKDLRGEQSR
jgi:hypothetical protein